MAEPIPLNPITKEDIQKLANALLIGSLFRPDILEKIRDPTDRVTWVDSLAIAAWAFAMRKAGMSIPEIAEQLGRTEQTIRKHLEGETEAGKIVRETYEKIKKGEEVITLDLIARASKVDKIKEELTKKIEELEQKIKSLTEEITKIKEEIQKI